MYSNMSNKLFGGSSNTTIESNKPGVFIPITSTQYLELQSYTDLSEKFNKHLKDLFSIFLINQLQYLNFFINELKSDEFIPININITIDKVSIPVHKILKLDTLNIKNNPLFIKYYLQRFFIKILPYLYNCNDEFNKEVEKQNQRLSLKNLDLFIIHNILEIYVIIKTNIQPNTQYLDMIRTPPILNAPLIVNQSGGTIANFNNIRDILELIAEPKHDFAGSRSKISDIIGTKYKGTYSGLGTDMTPDETRTAIRNIDNLCISENAGWFKRTFLKK